MFPTRTGSPNPEESVTSSSQVERVVVSEGVEISGGEARTEAAEEAQVPTTPHLLIRVKAIHGGPVPECLILYRGPRGCRTLGRTDEKGELKVDATDLHGGCPAARHRLYSQLNRAMPEEPPSVLEILLTRGESLGGRVVLPDGSPAPSGVRLRLLEEGGVPLRTSRSVTDTRLISSTYMDPESIVPPQRDLEATLAGLSREEFTARGYETFFLFCGRSDIEALDPLVLRVLVPGYAPADARVPAARLRKSLHVEEILLDPVARAWTECIVRFEGSSEVERSAAAPKFDPLMLKLESENGAALRIALGGESVGMPSIHRVPTGRYRIELSGPGTARLGADRSFVVNWKGPTDEFVIPWPGGAGSLVVVPEGPDGLTISSDWTLFHRRAGSEDSYFRMARFDRVPGCVPMLAAGLRELYAAPGHTPSPTRPAATVEVTLEAGQVTRARVRSSWQ